MKLGNESVLREILEQSLAGYWDWDIPSGNEYLSPSFKKMIGYEDHEIENRVESWQRLIFAEDLPLALEKFDQHVASKGAVPYKLEVRYRHKNGSTVWVICSGKMIEWDAYGKPLRMVGCHIDITERKQIEEALAARERRFSQLIRNSFDTIVILDREGVQRYISEGGEKVHGFSNAELLDLPVIEKMIHPEDQAHVLAAFHEIFKTGEGGVEYRHRHKSGGWVHLEARGTNQLDNPDIRGIIINVRDVTERKKAELELRQNEEKLRTFLANQPGVAFAVDKNGIFTLSEGQGLTRLGLKPGQVVGLSVFAVYKDIPEICEKIEQALKGNVRQFQATVNKAVFDVWVGPIFNIEGMVDGAIGISADITERKHTEEALANVQKLESLGILAGGIAHDFNNLMGGIFGYVDLASEASNEPKVKQHLAKVMQTIDRARALTGQLLTFSKGGSPKLDVAPLFPFVQQTAQFALSGSNVSCTFNIAEDLWPASFDKNQIGQVIDNLIINAKQAMPMGGTISISAGNVKIADTEHPVLKVGNYVRLSVTDTGVGIPKELQKRIFDPFFTTKARGHGLGLATCYSIVRRHSGSIDVYSEPGNGATFTVYLPAIEKFASTSNDEKRQNHFGSGTFLVLDDEPVILEVIAAMLKNFGYRVVVTANGEEAVEYIAAGLSNNRLPVAMLFDLTVPGAMGGKEAIALIRNMGVNIPAFVASGYADDPIMKNPAAYGFTASIGKPFQRAELVAMLENTMPKNRPKDLHKTDAISA